jgi:uncharacterized protein YydD (DUF2326 family)
MIHRVFSSLTSFKPLHFRSGLNILLSDKSPGATDLQTRNRAGKSSLVELIHFVCGGNCDSDSTFRAEQLIDSTFGLELDVFGSPVRVARSAGEPSKIVVERGDTTHWPRQPKQEKGSERLLIANMAWRTVLGRAFFALDEEDDDAEAVSGRPTFRGLFAYFARRETNGGMREPTRNAAMQQLGDAQIATSYLIGLDWTIAHQWERVRQKEKQIKELKRIVGQGVLSEVLDSAASLRSRLVVAEQKLNRIVSTLSSFRVHEQYKELEREASTVSQELALLADENELDRTYVAELDNAMHAEEPPAPEDLTSLYREAGVLLPELVVQRYEDVLRFHESVVRNRRSYLQSEQTAASERIQARDTKRSDLDRRRSELMTMLKSHGALETFVALQAEHGRLQADVETLRRRFDAASQLESTSSSLESDRVHLVERLRQEFSERSAVLDEAIRTFSAIVEELYGEPGQLEFHPTHNGPEIRIAIQGDRSRGIGNMEIFCFDMMLQRMCARQKVGPGFVVHDSHLFDGVDPRQTGRALAIGARLADEIGFQYLVTLNSDVLSELPADFDAARFVLPMRLTDATDDGGLFGLRFEPPRGDEPDDAPRRRKKPERARLVRRQK